MSEINPHPGHSPEEVFSGQSHPEFEIDPAEIEPPTDEQKTEILDLFNKYIDQFPSPESLDGAERAELADHHSAQAIELIRPDSTKGYGRTLAIINVSEFGVAKNSKVGELAASYAVLDLPDGPQFEKVMYLNPSLEIQKPETPEEFQKVREILESQGEKLDDAKEDEEMIGLPFFSQKDAGELSEILKRAVPIENFD